MEKLFKQNMHRQQKFKDANGKIQESIIKRRYNTRTTPPPISPKQTNKQTKRLKEVII